MRVLPKKSNKYINFDCCSEKGLFSLKLILHNISDRKKTFNRQ